MKKYRLVLIRHGESVWNRANRFTGWVDIGLSPLGKGQATKAGQILAKNGFKFDAVFTSVLRRATMTTKLLLVAMNFKKVLVKKDWRLNERHYGALQGLNKSEMAAKFGEAQVLTWRRSYNIRPPKLKLGSQFDQTDSKLYSDIKVPLTECLKDVVARVVPYWQKEIAPLIKQNKQILISAHGNSLRALIKYLDKVPDKEIVKLNLPTGVPLVYELDEKLKPIRHYYLGDKREIARLIKAVEKQGKK